MTKSAPDRRLLDLQRTTNYVRPVAWIGRCGLCGEDSPEVRDSMEAAQRDADECPCRADSEVSR